MNLPPPIPSRAQRPFDRTKAAAIILFIFGLVLGGLFGPIRVSCFRVTSDNVSCEVTRWVALGLIKAHTTEISDVVEAKLDKQALAVDRLTYAERRDMDRSLSAERRDMDRSLSAERRTIYGALIIGDKELLVNGYDASSAPAEKVLEPVSRFLAGDQLEMSVQERNYRLDILTLGSLAGAGGLWWLSRSSS